MLGLIIFTILKMSLIRSVVAKERAATVGTGAALLLGGDEPLWVGQTPLGGDKPRPYGVRTIFFVITPNGVASS